MELNQEQFDKWLDQLYYGKHKKGKKVLNPSKNHYCCLGVGCKMFIEEPRLDSNGLISGHYPTDQVDSPYWLSEIDKDYEEKTGKPLSKLNDWGFEPGDNYSHKDISIILDLVYNHKALDTND